MRTAGISVSTVALLLSASVAFAEEGPKPGMMFRPGPNGPMPVSSTTVREGEKRPPQLGSTTPRMPKEEFEKRMASTTKRLGDIKDKAKQDMAQKLATQFSDLNKKWTNEFSHQLDQMDKILGKVKDRAATDAAAGKDVAATNAALDAAQAALKTARDAVAAQAAKTYALDPATIPSTATSTNSGQEKIMQTLRNSFQTLQKSLFQDLFALRDGAMKDARRAVQEAIRTLGKVEGMKEKNATSTEAH